MGIVLIDPNLCMGCKYCEWNCPYSAPQFNHEKGIMEKCNLCYDYVLEGKRPSCVDSCPTRALDFGEVDELKKNHIYKDHIHPLPKQDLTKPSVLINPHKNALKDENANAEISNLEEVRYA